MKKIMLAAAVAAFLCGINATAQQPAGSAEGGISAEMLAEISKGYEDSAFDKAYILESPILTMYALPVLYRTNAQHVLFPNSWKFKEYL